MDTKQKITKGLQIGGSIIAFGAFWFFLFVPTIPLFFKIALPLVLGGGAFLKFYYFKEKSFYRRTRGKNFQEWMAGWGVVGAYTWLCMWGLILLHSKMPWLYAKMMGGEYTIYHLSFHAGAFVLVGWLYTTGEVMRKLLRMAAVLMMIGSAAPILASIYTDARVGTNFDSPANMESYVKAVTQDEFLAGVTPNNGVPLRICSLGPGSHKVQVNRVDGRFQADSKIWDYKENRVYVEDFLHKRLVPFNPSYPDSLPLGIMVEDVQGNRMGWPIRKSGDIFTFSLEREAVLYALIRCDQIGGGRAGIDLSIN